MMTDPERHVGLALKRIGELRSGRIIAIDFIERAFRPEDHAANHRNAGIQRQ